MDWTLVLPLALSLASVPIWALVLGGITDHHRHRRPIPARVVPAMLLAVMVAALSRLVSSPLYFDPSWAPVSSLAGHIERGVLVTAGLYALWLLARSRRHWR